MPILAFVANVRFSNPLKLICKAIFTSVLMTLKKLDFFFLPKF